MIKAFRLVAKPAGLTPEEFRWQWLLNHGPVVRQAVAHSPIAKATASFVAPRQIEEYGEGHQVPVPLDFDGMESLYFPTMVHLREALASGVLAELDASLDAVAGGASSVPRVVALEDSIVRRPDADEVLGGWPRQKLIRTLRKKEGTDRYQFRDHWWNHHRVLESGSAYMGPMPMINVSFSYDETIDDAGIRPVREEDGLMNLDGVIEIYHGPGADIISGYKRPFNPATRRDELNFLSMELPIRRAVMAEHLLATT